MDLTPSECILVRDPGQSWTCEIHFYQDRHQEVSINTLLLEVSRGVQKPTRTWCFGPGIDPFSFPAPRLTGATSPRPPLGQVLLQGSAAGCSNGETPRTVELVDREG